LPDKPVVVDVGAYHGQYAVLLGKIVQSKNGRLIAVEPSAINAQVLRQNVQLNSLNDTVEVVESFVQDAGGKDISLIEWGSQTTVDSTGEGVKVRSESISTLLHRLNIKKIDLLLIDIEGAEVKLLPSYPWADVPVGCIYCEMHPGEWHRFGSDGSEIERVLREQQMLCLDMYFQPFDKFSKQHYAGPTVMIKQPCVNKA
jgi:FkbM family methyltransferase